MKGKSLLETNPYLRDPETRERLIMQSVVSSCGVEGITVDLSKVAHIHIPRRVNMDVEEGD